MAIFDLQHPFFKPLWRRVLTVLACLGWSVFEFSGGAPFWGVLFGGVGLMAVWTFFFDFKPRDSITNNKKDSDG